MRPAWIAGVGNTPFGRLEGRDALDLMAAAAAAALEDAGRPRAAIDGVLCGYATTTPHLMLSTLFCERAGIRPAYAHAMQLGGATGGAMIMLARELVRAGRCENVLVVAGENRATGQARDSSIQTLAQVGDADFEVPYGASVPAYYALLASRYMHETGLTEADLAGFAVLMRRHAATHPDAHLREPITIEDVLASKPIASPLKLLDCCPISDGAMALVVSATPAADAAIAIRGAGTEHPVGLRLELPVGEAGEDPSLFPRMHFSDANTGKTHWMQIERVMLFDPWAQVEETFASPAWAEQMTTAEREETRSRLLASIAEHCPRGMRYPVIEYTCEAGISLRFHAQSYLDAVPDQGGNGGAFGIIAGASRETGRSGMRLRSAAIETPVPEGTESIAVECFAYRQEMPDCKIEYKR